MKPIIKSFSPKAQSQGDKVTIRGSGFTGTSSVKFGEINAQDFSVINDGVIEAYVPAFATGIISVTNPDGSYSLAGFSLLNTKVKLPQLPPLGRDIQEDDLLYVWDHIKNILAQSPASALPLGSGGGGGSDTGNPGNVYTALGSPFKVRVGDDNYSYDETANTVTITDIRLLGKSDYVVYASDLNGEFENDDLAFSEENGTVTISDYQLSLGAHLTIYADGIVSQETTNYLLGMKGTISLLKQAVAPFLPSFNSQGVLTNAGGIVAWFRPANEIPEGWQEWLPGRGRTLIGQDPTDVVTADNPEGLSRPNGQPGGSRELPRLVENNIPRIQLRVFGNGDNNGNITDNPGGTANWSSNKRNGNQDYDIKLSTQPATMGVTSSFGSANPDPIEAPLNPYRIVNFICSIIQTT